MYIIIAEQNLYVLVFWVEIVLAMLNYRHRIANLGVFQTARPIKFYALRFHGFFAYDLQI